MHCSQFTAKNASFLIDFYFLCAKMKAIKLLLLGGIIMKRISRISIVCVLIIALIASFASFTAFAAEEKYTEGDFTYSVSGLTATIIGYSGAGGDVVIPETLGGYTVVSIGKWPDAYIPNFSAGTSLTIPATVTYINPSAVLECDDIIISEDNEWYSAEDGVLFSKNKTALIRCPVGKSGTYIIPDSVETIDESAFYQCKNLSSVVFGNSVTTLGESAFAYCSGLESVVISDSVTTIGKYAFAECTALKSVDIPAGVTEIDSVAFSLNDSLASISVANDNTAYSSENGVLFNKDKTILICYPGGKTDASYTVPSSVEAVGDFSFTRNRYLTSVTVPDSVKTIMEWAFAFCTSLKNVTLGENVAYMGYGCFYQCTGLESVTAPNSLTEIEDSAFEECESLTIHAASGSYAYKYATDMGIKTVATDAPKDENNNNYIWWIVGGAAAVVVIIVVAVVIEKGKKSKDKASKAKKKK